jgi:hypothetical protein
MWYPLMHDQWDRCKIRKAEREIKGLGGNEVCLIQKSNKSARRSHFVPMEMPTVCGKTCPLSIANILSVKNSMISISESFLKNS